MECADQNLKYTQQIKPSPINLVNQDKDKPMQNRKKDNDRVTKL